MLKQRVTTAIFLLAFFLLSLLLLPTLGFDLLVGVVMGVAAWEWSKLSGFTQGYQKCAYTMVAIAIGVFLGIYVGLLPVDGLPDLSHQPNISAVFMVAGVWWSIALLWVQGYPSSAVIWGWCWFRVLIGLMVLVPSALALIFIHSLPHGPWLILLLVMIVATADTGAYFFGRAFGKHKLAKSVSPGKSWEGLWGGLLTCVLLGTLFAFLMELESWLVLIFIVLPTALVSVLGDLLESMIKRHSGMKDSGRCLPGHGGILDRIDGLTAAAPIFALALILSDWRLPLI